MLLIAGGIIASLGFILRRWYVGEHSQERANKWATLAGLATQLKNCDITLDEIRQLELVLHGQHPTTAATGKPPKVESEAEMNSATALELEKFDLELQLLLNRLDDVCDCNEFRLLQKAQATWKLYRNEQADFVASIFEGGSMRPL